MILTFFINHHCLNPLDKCLSSLVTAREHLLYDLNNFLKAVYVFFYTLNAHTFARTWNLILNNVFIKKGPLLYMKQSITPGLIRVR